MMRFPRWLSWIILIGLGWILFVGNTRDDRVVPVSTNTETNTAPAEPKRYKEIEALFDGERWKKGLFPDYQSPEEACRMAAPAEGKLGSYALVLQAVSGDGANCGDVVPFTVTRRNADGTAGKAQDVTLTLGEQKGLDGLLVGMQPGEKRLLIVNLPSKLKTLPALPANTQLLLDVKRN